MRCFITVFLIFLGACGEKTKNPPVLVPESPALTLIGTYDVDARGFTPTIKVDKDQFIRATALTDSANEPCLAMTGATFRRDNISRGGEQKQSLKVQVNFVSS